MIVARSAVGRLDIPYDQVPPVVYPKNTSYFVNILTSILYSVVFQYILFRSFISRRNNSTNSIQYSIFGLSID